MIYNFPIDQKSLFYNIAPCVAGGSTATVATPIYQYGKLQREEYQNLACVSTELSGAQFDVVAAKILGGDADFKVNHIWVFKDVLVNGESVVTDSLYCFYEKEQLKEGVHKGRRRLHYGLSFKFIDGNLKIDNDSVIKNVSQALSNEAFVVTAFQYDDHLQTLNFVAKLVGPNNVPYEDVFSSHKGVGNKLTEDAMHYEAAKLIQTPFSTIVDGLSSAAEDAELKYSTDLVGRFAAALAAKPFLVLTGLTGSGKTKLAQVVTLWLSSVVEKSEDPFAIGTVIKAAESEYKILKSDSISLLISQEKGGKAVLLREMISDWVDVIKEHGFDKPGCKAKPKDVQALVIQKYPEYSGQLQSFHTPLLAFAKRQIDEERGGDELRTVLFVPVGADWTNNEKLLGYPNALDPEKYVLPDTGVLKLMLDARDNPNLPFFLILDEMNLSHVERYFADFLSTMESEEEIRLYDGKDRVADDGTPVPQRLKFPRNLFVIGTMNVDETTYMFSPKVLDRAQVIEFRVSAKEMTDFLSSPTCPNLAAIAGKGAKYAEAFLRIALERKCKKPGEDELKAVKEALGAFFPELAKLGAEFGYRSAMEIVTFVAYYLDAAGYDQMPAGTEKAKVLNAAIDAAILQKLLPKLHGSLNRLGPVLDALIGKASKKILVANDPDAEPEVKVIYKLTYEKLCRMKERVEKNGFTSFAEA